MTDGDCMLCTVHFCMGFLLILMIAVTLVILMGHVTVLFQIVLPKYAKYKEGKDDIVRLLTHTVVYCMLKILRNVGCRRT